jgi:hypothetical protein
VEVWIAILVFALNIPFFIEASGCYIRSACVPSMLVCRSPRLRLLLLRRIVRPTVDSWHSVFAVETKAVLPFALQSMICTVRSLENYPDPLLVRANVLVIVDCAGLIQKSGIAVSGGVDARGLYQSAVPRTLGLLE